MVDFNIIVMEVQMIRPRMIFLAFALIVFASFLISCGNSTESPTATTVPTNTSEPAVDTEFSSEGGVPTQKGEVPRIMVEELKERLDNGEAIVIADSRDARDYNSRHIAGAISVPEYEVEEHLDELPLDQEIVFYCT